MKSKRNNQVLEVSLSIPSGEVVYADGFGEEFEVDKKECPETLNETMGLKQMTEAYARIQIFHAFVGNSCPSLYKEGNKITIASKSFSRKTPSKVQGRKIGTIITDLWWYSLMDRAEYLKRGGDPKTPFFKVKAGQYLLKHNLHSGYFDGDDEVIYATLELSNKKAKEWKLPEEEMLPLLREELKVQMKDEKASLYLSPRYSQLNNRFLGYKATLYLDKGHSNFFFQEEDYQKNKKHIIKELVQAAKDWGSQIDLLTDMCSKTKLSILKLLKNLVN